MRIIFEGPDGVGKTTLANKIADHFGCDIIHMTEKGSKAFDDYSDKAWLRNIVSDRCFMSEIIYSTVFDRKPKISAIQFESLLRQYRDLHWKIIVLDAPTDVIKKRLKLRNDEDEAKIKKINELRTVYLGVAKFYDIPIIDSDTPVEEIIKFLEESK